MCRRTPARHGPVPRRSSILPRVGTARRCRLILRERPVLRFFGLRSLPVNGWRCTVIP
nr:MAG TPA: hypothetical protein [Caudoviricetes sp.]